MKRTLAEHAPLMRTVAANMRQMEPSRRLAPAFPGLGLAILSGLAWLAAAVIFGLALEPVSLWLRGWLI